MRQQHLQGDPEGRCQDQEDPDGFIHDVTKRFRTIRTPPATCPHLPAAEQIDTVFGSPDLRVRATGQIIPRTLPRSCSSQVVRKRAGPTSGAASAIGTFVSVRVLRVRRTRTQSTVASVIGAGLMLANTAVADPYNPAERALGGGLVGAGTGAVIGAIAEAAVAPGSVRRLAGAWAP
jgi:hypothetical protein